jgi:hypothetical protein
VLATGEIVNVPVTKAEQHNAALNDERRLPQPLESWVEPPYEILCPLSFHEVKDVGQWDHLRPLQRIEKGLYLCQPLCGRFAECGVNRTPCWLLVLRILLGSYGEHCLFRTFWLSEKALERSSKELLRLGLPVSVARQTVQFDRGGVLAVINWNLNEDDQFPYTISSMTNLVGIGTLHNQYLEYQLAVREQARCTAPPASR